MLRVRQQRLYSSMRSNIGVSVDSIGITASPPDEDTEVPKNHHEIIVDGLFSESPQTGSSLESRVYMKGHTHSHRLTKRMITAALDRQFEKKSAIA